MIVGPDTVALVTGADSGIGLGIARELAATGAHVVISGLDERRLAATAADLPGRITTRVLDVRDRQAWREVVDSLVAEHGGIDLLVSNAGVGFLAPALDATYEQWDWVIDINLTGAFNAVRTVVPHMVERGRPAHVVATASIGGMLAASGAVYAAAKAGVVGFMEAVQTELRDTPVNVSILLPGIVRTNIAHGPRPPGDAADVNPGGADLDLLYETPMEPDEVGRRVLAGIEQEDLFIFTHAEHRPMLEQRFSAILRSVPDEEAPERRARVERMVLQNPMYAEQRPEGRVRT